MAKKSAMRGLTTVDYRRTRPKGTQDYFQKNWGICHKCRVPSLSCSYGSQNVKKCGRQSNGNDSPLLIKNMSRNTDALPQKEQISRRLEGHIYLKLPSSTSMTT
jgi:hypothetical protein